MTFAVRAPLSMTCKVPVTTDVCSVAVSVVVAPLLIVGLPNAAANGLASDSVALSASLATKLIDVPTTDTLATVGASLTAATVTNVVPTLLRLLAAAPSLTWNPIVRAAVLGLSLVLLYVTERSAAW